MLPVVKACRLAGVERDRFNLAVHQKHYPCAPEVVPGSTRKFDRDDFIALAVYGHFLRRGFSSAVAGDLACRVRTLLDNDPAATKACIGRTDSTIDWVTSDFDFAMGKLRVPTVAEVESGDEDALNRALFPIISLEVVNLAALAGRFAVANDAEAESGD